MRRGLATTERPVTRLRVDPVACDGIGQCALAAPELITLDRWGFPVLAGGATQDPAAARRAVAACPRHALWVRTEAPDEERRSR